MAVEEKRYSNVKEILGVLEKHLQDYHINPTKKKKFREMRQCLIVQGGMCSLESKL